MTIRCIWEHNGPDTLLYVEDYPGAFARGEHLDVALEKIPGEVAAYRRWLGLDPQPIDTIEVVQEQTGDLQIRDADSDVIFASEKLPLSREAYADLKALALKSAADFQRLYDAVPDVDVGQGSGRRTFYGPVPRSAREMYEHTKNVNEYYFWEIGVDTDNLGSIAECRKRGFEKLEQMADFLTKPATQGSYGESWSLRKVLRRFIWHDRIHAKAMYRMAVQTFGPGAVPDIFYFETERRDQNGMA